MRTSRYSSLTAATALLALVLITPANVQSLAPLVYTISFPDPASKTFTVDVIVPTDGRALVDVMMPVWSPGFYGLQNYAERVTTFNAKGADGTMLDVRKPKPSRWTIATGGRPSFAISYTVSAPRGSNLSNGVTETSAVLVGPATYVTLAENASRPAEVRLELPPAWTGSMTSLEPASDQKPNHYVAPNYDILADSPILAGTDLTSTKFVVGGITHYWTYLGNGEWEGARVAGVLTPLIEEHIRFWGTLPFKNYAFLNIVTGGRGGSGVEHLN